MLTLSTLSNNASGLQGYTMSLDGTQVASQAADQFYVGEECMTPSLHALPPMHYSMSSPVVWSGLMTLCQLCHNTKTDDSNDWRHLHIKYMHAQNGRHLAV